MGGLKAGTLLPKARRLSSADNLSSGPSIMPRKIAAASREDEIQQQNEGCRHRGGHCDPDVMDSCEERFWADPHQDKYWRHREPWDSADQKAFGCLNKGKGPSTQGPYPHVEQVFS